MVESIDAMTALTFQEIIMRLDAYWAAQGCLVVQPYDVEVGAGTAAPSTFLRVLGPEPWSVAYPQPSRRPDDGRYAENPNRYQHYFQYQVILKPAPADPLGAYLDSLAALGVSHASVYRHFESKAALRDAVTERWLESISTPLAAIASEEGPAPERLRRWLDGLVHAKRRKALEDPELFATYVELAAGARDVVRAHVETLVGQLARIVEDGVAGGALRADEPRAAARAAFDATSRFHNPAHAAEWSDPQIDDAYNALNANSVRAVNSSYGSAWLRPQQILDPRLLQIGGQISF